MKSEIRNPKSEELRRRVHKCPVKGCAAIVPDQQLMCLACWRQVPIGLQNAVWHWNRVAHHGHAHYAAMRAAVAAVENSQKETDATKEGQ